MVARIDRKPGMGGDVMPFCGLPAMTRLGTKGRLEDTSPRKAMANRCDHCQREAGEIEERGQIMARKLSPWKRCCKAKQAPQGIEALEVAPTDLDTESPTPSWDTSDHSRNGWVRRPLGVVFRQSRGDSLEAVITGTEIEILRRNGGGLQRLENCITQVQSGQCSRPSVCPNSWMAFFRTRWRNTSSSLRSP